MLLNNKKRITLVSFLAYFVMSGMLAPIGIISGPMSEYFDQPITELTAHFSWLTFGILAGSIIALLVFDWIPLRKLMIGLYSLILVCLISFSLHDNIDLIWPALGLVGVCCGVGLAGAAVTISRTYELNRRASMLVITDGSFSAAGIVCSWVAVILIARQFHWSGTYQFVALIAGIIVLLAVVSTFPKTTADTKTSHTREPWPASVWLCVCALFLYTLGQYSMLWWLPNYAETQLGAPRDQAGFHPQHISETAIGHSTKDIKEFFHLVPGGQIPPSLKDEILEYRELVMQLGTVLFEWLQRETPREVSAQFSQPLPEALSSTMSLLRILHYPPLTGGEDALAERAAPHEDINFLTILPVADQPGLQVKGFDGEWIDVASRHGDLIVNAGDMLREASGGYFPSTTHRVVNPSDASGNVSRLSIPFFLAPQMDFVLSARYTAGSYLKERLRLIGC